MVSAISMSVALTGCGGGGGGSADDMGAMGGSTPSPVASDVSRSFLESVSTNFQPNYVADVQEANLRRWAKRSFNVFVRLDRGTDRTQQVVNELNRWQVATEGDFSFQTVAQEEGADLIVEFLPAEELGPGRLGQARVSYSQSTGILRRAELELSQDVTDAMLPTVVTHEVGHALGLNGHSSQSSDMLFGQYRNTMKITERDLNTLYYAYREGRSSRPAAAASEDDLHTEIVECPL